MREHWIIVGAGSAGCVLANRLSADGSREITLLDDGPDLEPGAVPAAISSPNFFAALAEPGRSHPDLMAVRSAGIEPTLYQRGRGIGGSSAVNAMVALRGTAAQYSQWGWHDADQAWEQILIPAEQALLEDLGAVDRALLDAEPRARRVGLTRRGELRVTAAEAYLWPALDRPNLTVRADCGVRSVRVDERQVTGVLLADHSELVADRVIMAAGAIHTPTILLRSGIDTPGIGAGLQDHPSVVFTLQLRSDTPHDPDGLAIGSVYETELGHDLVQLLPMSNLGPSPDAAGLGALMVALMTPTSRSGSVSVDSDGQPIVDFALLTDDRDLDVLVDATLLALEMLQRPAFEHIVEQVFIDAIGTPVSVLKDHDSIASWIRRSCGDYVHATSTCAMGTVVDQRGAVRGYDGLFVCDASVFPTIPDANTHLPTTMLAERLSTRLMTSAG